VKGFTIAGHVAIDQVITLNGESTQLGGPPSFASALGKALGFPVHAVTKIGFDLSAEFNDLLSQLGINVTPSSYPTTRFVIDYRHEPRLMSAPAKCEPIRIEDVQDTDRLLICPIVDEISDKLLREIDPDFLAIDPQGLLRDIGADHKVSPRKWCNRRILEKLDILKTSSSEHHLITGCSDIQRSLRKLVDSGVGVAVITDGVNGSYIMSDRASIKVPPFPVEVVDSTGAGDVFISGLASHLDEGLEWACAVASASSSAIVETHGPKIECTRKEIMQRAEEIHEKIQKLGESSSGDPVDG